jgi:hypothetical protein
MAASCTPTSTTSTSRSPRSSVWSAWPCSRSWWSRSRPCCGARAPPATQPPPPGWGGRGGGSLRRPQRLRLCLAPASHRAHRDAAGRPGAPCTRHRSCPAAIVAFFSGGLFLDVQVESPARLVARGAAVDVPLEVTCSGTSSADVFVSVSQKAGSGVAQGSGFTSVGCTGSGQQVIVRVQASEARPSSMAPRWHRPRSSPAAEESAVTRQIARPSKSNANHTNGQPYQCRRGRDPAAAAPMRHAPNGPSLKWFDG